MITLEQLLNDIREYIENGPTKLDEFEDVEEIPVKIFNSKEYRFHQVNSNLEFLRGLEQK